MVDKERKFEEMKDQLVTANSKIEELKNEKDELFENLDKANRRIRDLKRGSVMDVNQDSSKPNDEDKNLKTKHFDIERKLARLSALQEENAVLHSDLNNAQSLRKYFMERASAFEKEVKGHRGLISEKDSEIVNLKKRVQTLSFQKTFDHKTLEEKISSLKKELQTYKEEYKSVSNRNPKMKALTPNNKETREKKVLAKSDIYLPVLPKPQLFHFRESSIQAEISN